MKSQVSWNLLDALASTEWPGTRAFFITESLLHSARTQSETSKALKEATQHYKVDTDAFAQKAKAEFAAKEKAQAAKKTAAKAQPRPAKTTAAKKAKAA